MKAFKYKLLAIGFLVSISVQAQTFDKKVKEKFKVNSDVELVINTSNADVTIETWNKNEVAIEAVMEVEGVEEKEANRILDKWKFKALGNKNRIEVSSGSSHFETYNLDFLSEIDIPEFDIPDVDMPDIDIHIPHFDMPDLSEIAEFDYDAYKNDSTYLGKYKIKISKQVEKFKNSEWKHEMDSIWNSEEMRIEIEDIKNGLRELKIEMEDFQNSDEIKIIIEDAKRIAEDVKNEILENKHLWEEHGEKSKEMAHKLKEDMKKHFDSDSLFHRDENTYIFFKDKENSKVKIKKTIKIKVPKKATFDLNVRHGKLKVPKSSKKISANISYGNFIGGEIVGEDNELRISNSPVIINELSSGNITLKNVPNAQFGTFNNVNMFSNSSEVVISKVGSNVDLSQKFGNIEILEIDANFDTCNIILDYANANINLSDTSFTYQIVNKKSTSTLNKSLNETSETSNDGVKISKGFNKDKSSSNKLILTAVYSDVTIK